MPVRIEFLGVPGAGKTSLVPVAIDESQRAGLGAVGVDDAVYAALRAGMQDRVAGPLIRYLPRRFGRGLQKRLVARSQDRMLALRRFFLEQPETVIAILEALRERRDVDPRQDLALGWIVELLWQYQLLTDQGGSSPVVFDEGFSNRALTLFAYRFSEGDDAGLRRYIEAIPAPDLVIAVTGDAEKTAARVSTRLRFGYLTTDEAVEYTRDAAACVDATTALLRERGVDVRSVQNGSSLAAASSEVRRTIRNWIESR